jgi:hypothetical protein
MIDKGMDNEKQVLKVDCYANNRIEEIKSGTKPALTLMPMQNILPKWLLI